MKYNIYRTIRNPQYEEWIISRDEIPYVERLVIIFEKKNIKLFIISADKTIEENEELLYAVQNLFHFHSDYIDSTTEFIFPEPKDGKILDEENEIDIIGEASTELIKKEFNK